MSIKMPNVGIILALLFGLVGGAHSVHENAMNEVLSRNSVARSLIFATLRTVSIIVVLKEAGMLSSLTTVTHQSGLVFLSPSWSIFLASLQFGPQTWCL
jgi:hypothetical protein